MPQTQPSPTHDKRRATAWQEVARAHDAMGPMTLRTLFEQDADRFRAFSVTHGKMLYDFSKQRIDRGALAALIALAEASNLAEARDTMFTGAPINTTEARPVRHVALRSPATDLTFEDVSGDVHSVLDRMLAFAEAVRDGTLKSASGESFTDVINLGIGGSDLGPCMATRALAANHTGPRVHYVSNVDAAHLADTIKPLDARRTLVLVASKSFTTLETMMNARTARQWIIEACGAGAVADQFAALSTNLKACAEFGVGYDRIFGFWDWVGGRYSLWSAIGLPLAIAIGSKDFRELLAGAYVMDQHFRSAPLARNLPVLAAMIGIWNRNFEGHASLGLIPYDERLGRLPAFVQQLDMESNGKSVDAHGRPVKIQTAPIIWGEPGTNAQHAFFQMLHQGTTIVPLEFLVAAQGHEIHARANDHHLALVGNCLAQSEAFALGETQPEAHARMIRDGMSESEATRLAAHKTFPGNRPSSTLLYPQLTPSILGQILAFYEHKVFTQGVIWGINSFDQWGVQLGKLLADEVAELLTGNGGAASGAKRNGSTAGLANAVQALRLK